MPDGAAGDADVDYITAVKPKEAGAVLYLLPRYVTALIVSK